MEEGSFNQNGSLVHGKIIYKSGNVDEGHFENGVIETGLKKINGWIHKGPFRKNGSLTSGEGTSPDGRKFEGIFDYSNSNYRLGHL